MNKQKSTVAIAVIILVALILGFLFIPKMKKIGCSAENMVETKKKLNDLEQQEQKEMFFLGLIHVSKTPPVTKTVPTPKIEVNIGRNANGWCSVTLHCSVPANSSGISYSWQKGNKETGHQRYGNGSTIQVSLPSNSCLNEEYICTVSRSANEKSATIHIENNCSLIKNCNQLSLKGHFISFTANTSLPDCSTNGFAMRWKNKTMLDPIDVIIYNKDNSSIFPHFENHMEYIKDSHIKIYDMRMEHSGEYTLSSSYNCRDSKDELFYNLTVYEDVSTPYITHEKDCSWTGWCNVTLHCHVSSNSSVISYSWQKGNNETGYPHYMNANTIQFPLQCYIPLDEKYVCTVDYPGGQKSSEIYAKNICALEELIQSIWTAADPHGFQWLKERFIELLTANKEELVTGEQY
eukprot:XP_017951982.1 PREDICTED: uncharacterized protein LOC101734538 [Xenopus tropicalis]